MLLTGLVQLEGLIVLARSQKIYNNEYSKSPCDYMATKNSGIGLHFCNKNLYDTCKKKYS